VASNLPVLIHWIITFAGNAVVLSQTGTKAKKTISEFKNVVHPTSSVLTAKAINSAVKDFRKRLQARVSANGGKFEH